MIGDLQTSALVGADGSIDWLCLPRFDSSACFAALLGTSEHGHWALRPAAPVIRVERRYREGTLVLETDLHTADGLVRITDCMPPRSEAPDVVRAVECLGGRVPMRMELRIGFDYGSIIPGCADWVAASRPSPARTRCTCTPTCPPAARTSRRWPTSHWPPGSPRRSC